MFCYLKTKANGFWANNFPFLMMTKHMELLQIIWKETLSEDSPKHMHISNVSHKQDASKIAYEYDIMN